MAVTEPDGIGPDLTRTDAETVRTDGTGRSWRRLTLINAALALVCVAGGTVLWVARPHTLDTREVARTIADRVGHQAGGVVSVRCPDTARKSTGTTFQCSVVDAAGADRTVTVTVIDDEGRFTWRTEPADARYPNGMSE